MTTAWRSDCVIEQLAQEFRGERRLLRELTGRDLPARDAEQAFARILEHKWLMSERLGRDVGLRIAAIDYLENVSPDAPAARPPRRTPVRSV
jgi:Domain of unknown function (DUF4032)